MMKSMMQKCTKGICNNDTRELIVYGENRRCLTCDYKETCMKEVIKKEPFYHYCSNPWCHGHLMGYTLTYDDGTTMIEYATPSPKEAILRD